ncbi:MAG: hypothetical protein H0X30_24255 [Anaerolineae bacterium]|nr:hypothetical protein [Anaerolineae bacterium]
MPFSIQWDNVDKTIIYIRYEHWTWDDFYNAVKASTDLSLTVEHPVDIIAHLADSVIPQGSAFSHSGAALKQDNKKLGLIVVVTSNRFILSLMQVSSRIVPGWQNKYRMSSTLEKARELIANERQKSTAV